MSLIDWSDPDEMLGLLVEYVADEAATSHDDPDRDHFLNQLSRELGVLAVHELATADRIELSLRKIIDSQPRDFASDPSHGSPRSVHRRASSYRNRESSSRSVRSMTSCDPPSNSAVAPDANRCFTVLQEPASPRAVRAAEPQAVGRHNPHHRHAKRSDRKRLAHRYGLPRVGNMGRRSQELQTGMGRRCAEWRSSYPLTVLAIGAFHA
jgi:hypothetical protein